MAKQQITPHEVVFYLYKDLDLAVHYMALLDEAWGVSREDKEELLSKTGYWCLSAARIIVLSLVESLTMTLMRMNDESPRPRTCSFEQLRGLLIESEHVFAESFAELLSEHVELPQYKRLIIARSHVVAHRNDGIEYMRDELQPVLEDLRPVFRSSLNLMREIEKHFQGDVMIERKVSDAKTIFTRAKFELFPSLDEVDFAKFMADGLK